MLKWIAIGAIAILAAAGVASRYWPGDELTTVRIPFGDSTAVARGKAVYAEACASCHGANLEGQPNWRERLPNGRLPAPPHDETGHTWHHVDQHLFEITKYGVAKFAGPGYESDMFAFEGILSDSDILASLAYIKSTWPTAIQLRHTAMSNPS